MGDRGGERWGGREDVPAEGLDDSLGKLRVHGEGFSGPVDRRAHQPVGGREGGREEGGTG